MPFHRIRREVSDPDDVLRRRQPNREHAVGVAGLGHADPILAVERHAGAIVGPAVRIGRGGTISDAQSHFTACRAGQPEIEPLVKIGQVILDDLKVDAVAILIDDANVAGVERT